MCRHTIPYNPNVRLLLLVDDTNHPYPSLLNHNPRYSYICPFLALFNNMSLL
nr:MAG TPA: hypothetical protein [Caudoviricetes sp.]